MQHRPRKGLGRAPARRSTASCDPTTKQARLIIRYGRPLVVDAVRAAFGRRDDAVEGAASVASIIEESACLARTGDASHPSARVFNPDRKPCSTPIWAVHHCRRRRSPRQSKRCAIRRHSNTTSRPASAASANDHVAGWLTRLTGAEGRAHRQQQMPVALCWPSIRWRKTVRRSSHGAS